MKDPKFTVDDIRSISTAGAGLLKWVFAMVNYYRSAPKSVHECLPNPITSWHRVFTRFAATCCSWAQTQPYVLHAKLANSYELISQHEAIAYLWSE